MLEVRGLESGYKRSAVLQGVDLDVAAGQVLGLLGRNGVGKSTLINTLMGLVHPSKGTVTPRRPRARRSASRRRSPGPAWRSSRRAAGCGRRCR